MNTIYTNKVAIGNFDTSGTYYWTSTDNANATAWLQRFSVGTQTDGNKWTASYYTRCARR